MLHGQDLPAPDLHGPTWPDIEPPNAWAPDPAPGVRPPDATALHGVRHSRRHFNGRRLSRWTATGLGCWSLIGTRPGSKGCDEVSSATAFRCWARGVCARAKRSSSNGSHEGSSSISPFRTHTASVCFPSCAEGTLRPPWWSAPRSDRSPRRSLPCDHGANDFLLKPTTADQVGASLRHALGGEQREKVPPEWTILPDPMSLDRIQWEHLQRVLLECDWNISEAARRLRLHRQSLQRKLRHMPR